MNKTSTRMTGIIFMIVLLGLLILCIALPDKTFSEQENRMLEPFPSAEVKNVIDGDFMNDFEEYSSDSVVGRELWIKLKNSVDKSFGKNDNGSAYWGKQGYLFPIEKVDEVQLEKNLAYIHDFMEKVKQLGVTSSYMLPVPTSQEVLAEYMPEGAPRVDQADIIERTKSRLGKQLNVINVQDSLAEVKDSKYIYFKTDHHWTQLGAYYSYKAWAEACGIEHLDEGQMEMVKVAENFYGTTYSKIPTFNLDPDAIYTYRTPAMNEVVMEIDKLGIGFEAANNSTNKNDILLVRDMFDESYIETKDKYSYFLSNNHPLIHLYRVEGGSEKVREQLAQETHIDVDIEENDEEEEIDTKTKADSEDKNLLVIKDSYANCFIPFLTEHYDHIYVVDLRYYKKSVLELVDRYQVDEVMFLYNAVQLANDRNLVFLKVE